MAILNTYAAMGGPASRLGFPVTDVYTVPGAYRADFQGGYVLQDVATGAVTVH
jgi:uncharacterized protein with LGFP repeats